jgi:hypothetical protein
MTVERRPGPAPPEELPPDCSALPRVDERRDKELGSCSDDGGGPVLAAGQDRGTLLTRAGRSDLRRLR